MRRILPSLPLLPRFATAQRIAAEPINIIISSISKLVGLMAPNMATGRPSTMQMLKMLLPIMLPTRSSFSFLRAAVMVVTSSGSEVPKATMVRAMIRSETPTMAARVEAESTTKLLPKITPARPTPVIRKDLPSFHFGFSTSFFELRLFLTIFMM